MAQIIWFIYVLQAVLILPSSVFAAEIPSTLAASITTISTDKKIDGLLDTTTLSNPEIENTQQTENKSQNDTNADKVVKPVGDNATYDDDTPSINTINKLNATLLQNNQAINENVANQNETASEQDDLNQKEPQEDLDLARAVFKNETFGLPENSDITSVVNEDDVSEIQTGNNEDEREANSSSLIGKDYIIDDGPLVIQNGGITSQIPVIVASIFVILCVVGYTAMLMWRRYLERKYGNREMLINEEFDPSDMRHFSI
ncbi:uncharacterized protein [Atheta coriaria]|uniref:uncharacterized protein isoform X1 n=1 Tax=Dalotia coriaria TaxID=877792 RepID=UPI0031F43BC0